MKKRILLTIIILFPLVGCKIVSIDQDYFITSVLKDECLVSSCLRIHNYSYPLDTITEESETDLVSCDNVDDTMTTHYEKLGPVKIKLENKFK